MESLIQVLCHSNTELLTLVPQFLQNMELLQPNPMVTIFLVPGFPKNMVYHNYDLMHKNTILLETFLLILTGPLFKDHPQICMDNLISAQLPLKNMEYHLKGVLVKCRPNNMEHLVQGIFKVTTLSLQTVCLNIRLVLEISNHHSVREHFLQVLEHLVRHLLNMDYRMQRMLTLTYQAQRLFPNPTFQVQEPSHKTMVCRMKGA